ncbi:uncharacterized protein LOC123686462 [Harmonia axyridis]|uniref:uncharacterized protein LOC123686462 n=1 Tax=Harmonia axyridis TaxID=115357 RepID=UPI001E2792C3|nr:uncharacterized protein LOC123686462 [Harmonia axyridis]
MTFFYMAGIMCNIVLTAIFFYIHWDFRLLVENGFMLITFCFDLMMMSEAMFTSEDHFPLEELKKVMWSFSDAEPRVFQRIHNDIQFLRYMRIFITVILVCCALFVFPITGDLREFVCIFYLFDDIKNRFWYPYFEFFILIMKMVLTLTFSCPIFIMLTVVQDNAYSLMLLRQKIRSIEEIFGTKEMWFQDRAYQRYVEVTLKRSIDEHINIKRYNEIIARIIKRETPAIFVIGVLLFTTFYFSVKMNMNNIVLMKSLFIVMLVILFTYLFIKVGQLLKDESEDLYQDLCECPWFLWNKHNKSLYLMFLINSKKSLAVNSLNIDLDYSLIVRLAKTTMSLLTALQGLIE